MNDDQILHALHFDDAYEVRSVLADGPGGRTELVFLDGSGPFVRKKIPSELARRGVWSALAECACRRLPHVVATYELPDSFVTVYDYVPGETLESVVEQNGRLDAKDAVRLLGEVCEATGALHACHVVHRDLSPSNIVIAADGAHVIDLGIARVIAEAPAKSTTKLGTWGFASPEQFGFAQTDARSDVYAMGRVLAYALTGVRPDADDFAGALDRTDGIPASVKAVVEKACAFEPSGRYQSAEEMARALTACGAGAADVFASEVEGVDAAGCVEGAVDRVVSSGARPPRPGEKASRVSASSAAKRVAGGGSRRMAVIVACIAVAAVVVLAGAWALGGASGIGRQSQSAGSGMSANDSADSASSDGSSQKDGAESGASSASSIKSEASSGSSSAVSAESAEDMLSVVESGWSMGDDGYVRFAYALRNGSSSTTVAFPQVTVTGKSASGNILFTRETTLWAIGAGQTQYYASIGEASEMPASVEFKPITPSSYNLSTSKSTGSYSVNNVSESTDKYGMAKVTGEVTADEVGSDGSNQLMVTVVFRDGAGNIVGGDQAFVSCPAKGESVAFSTVPTFAANYESIEVHACDW